VRERVYLGGRLGVVIDIGKTGQGVASLNVHGAGTTDSFTAAPAKGERRILFVFDLDESVQNHGTTIVKIHGIGAEIWLLVVLFGVPSINLEVLDAFAGCLRLRLIDGGFEVGFRGRRKGRRRRMRMRIRS